jgi:hypothetical protein
LIKTSTFIEPLPNYRTITQSALSDFEYVKATGLLEKPIESGDLVIYTRADKSDLGTEAINEELILEREKIPLISGI